MAFLSHSSYKSFFFSSQLAFKCSLSHCKKQAGFNSCEKACEDTICPTPAQREKITVTKHSSQSFVNQNVHFTYKQQQECGKANMYGRHCFGLSPWSRLFYNKNTKLYIFVLPKSKIIFFFQNQFYGLTKFPFAHSVQLAPLEESSISRTHLLRSWPM